jgi:hypothetical protein
VTWSNHHVTVIPVWLLILTTVGNIPRHKILARVMKVSSRDGTRTGFGLRPGRGRRRRSYALTFHGSNGLLKPVKSP